MLRVRDLEVRYGDLVAVADIDLDLEQGETLALLGRSGSGKTTVLKAIAGLVPTTRGTIEVDGVGLDGVPAHRRDVGLVFQDFALFPHLDVGDNVAYGLRMHDIDGIEARVADALEMVGLSGMERRRIDQLSGGQAQRVALARTLAPRPRLLLLDEPLGSLDPDLRAGLAVEVKRLLDDTGVPTIVVTHDTAEAFALGDRLAVIVDGHIAASGTPAEVWRDPGSEAVARLVGHRSIVPVEVSAGIAGVGDASIPVAAPDGPAELLVLPGAATAPGPVTATVTATRYRGPDWVATVDLGDGSIDVATDVPPEIGGRLGITIDPDGVVVLE